jgi:hypothetical protein
MLNTKQPQQHSPARFLLMLMMVSIFMILPPYTSAPTFRGATRVTGWNLDSVCWLHLHHTVVLLLSSATV